VEGALAPNGAVVLSEQKRAKIGPYRNESDVDLFGVLPRGENLYRCGYLTRRPPLPPVLLRLASNIVTIGVLVGVYFAIMAIYTLIVGSD
jgi:hypothetical protein